ncbi:uncharacterized protein LOC133195281 [Saccostrea echinata]|uniref:uncharacterized protein LOC133195281 n=1 Tax=Saccostrea echinata TaxID=191078 RepID=UPI002A7F3C46|nr:uncharacterized protein LOC133195281 [Saccostrea echinata]
MISSEYKKQATTPNSQEITKLVRRHFRAPEAVSYQPHKTWTKTKNFMINERPDDLWEKHYLRRKENDSRGYQSVIGEKYKPLGDQVVLDTCDLVLNTMSKCLDPKIRKQPLFRCGEDGKHEKKHAITLPPIGHKSVSKASAVKESSSLDPAAIELPEVHSFREIKQFLDESKNIIRKVHAGYPYEEYVRKRLEMNRNKQEQNSTKENEMVLMSLTNLQLGLPDFQTHEEEIDQVKDSHVIKNKDHVSPGKRRKKSIMIDPNTNRRVSVDPLTQSLMKEELAARRMTLKSPINQGLTLGSIGENPSFIQEESYNQLLHIPSGVSLKKERLRRDHLQYLQALSMVITSISNMKTREIKSKTPLKLDAVKALRKEPVIEPRNPFHRRESRATTHLSRLQSRSQQPHVGLHREASVGRGMLEQVAGITGLTSKLRKKTMWGGVSKIQQPQQQGPIVETWEDLINLEEPKKTVDLTLQSRILMKALLWSRRRAITPQVESTMTITENTELSRTETSTGPTHIQSKIRKDLLAADHHRNTGPIHTKKLPIWQLVAMDKIPKSLQEKKKKETLQPENIVSNDKRSFLKVKHDLHKDLEEELQKIDREMLAVFKMKYGEFEDMSPLFEVHRSRLNGCVTGGTTHRNMAITDVPPLRWFEDLQEKTYSILGHQDEEINKTLQEIGRYSTIDSKSIPSAKAKLCLLLMSLPASELFTIPVQRGLKFVLEVIFQAEDHLLGEWLQHRKVPYFIKEATSP